MPYEFTQAFREAVASVNSTLAYVQTISCSHSLFPSTYRFAISDSDLLIGNVLYKGKQFTASLPGLKANSNEGINVKISNVTGDTIRYMKIANNSNEKIEIELAIFVAGQPTMTASFTSKLTAKSISFDETDLIMTAGYPDTFNKKLPAENYTTWECPGLRN